MRSVSSNVMFPELPDARMETRKPISCSPQPRQNLRQRSAALSFAQQASRKTDFQNHRRAAHVRQSEKKD